MDVDQRVVRVDATFSAALSPWPVDWIRAELAAARAAVIDLDALKNIGHSAVCRPQAWRRFFFHKVTPESHCEGLDILRLAWAFQQVIGIAQG